jgi:CubicO group peptidase (beta-lactamase class C family)
MKVVIAALSLLCLPAAEAQPPQGDESAASLAGLWSSASDFTPALKGELLITQVDGLWRGTLAGAEVRSATLDLDFGADGGRFHGALSASGDAIDAWWTQPPGLPGQAYATPLQLARTGDHAWRGEVTPLPQTFALYLNIARNEEGRWVGAFRNPEFNFNGGASRFLASRSGDTVSFSTPDGQVARTAMVRDAHMLSVTSPPLPQPLDLTIVSRSAALRFIPRPAAPYAYSRPPQTDDGWRATSANDVGFEEGALAAMIQRIIDSDPAGRRPQLIHSLLVARNGRLVLEEYFFGNERDTPHDIRSAGKSFASVLLGAAMHEGAPVSPATRVLDALSTDGPFANADPRKSAVTLAHLMTHTSGLDCNDNDDASRGNEGAMQGQTDQPDWWRFTLDLPMAHEPGERYAYCTAGINLVGAVLRKVTGQGVPDLFDRLIAQPLQFGRYYWNLAPNGEGYLGGGAYMRPRDLLKLGQLYLDGGVWNGRRVVSSEWVAASTLPHIVINETTTGMDADTFANVATHGADGYGWHRYGVRVGDKRIEAYEANGNGGQLLVVVPEYELVVVMTGGNYGQGGVWTRWRDEVMGGEIIKAIRH